MERAHLTRTHAVLCGQCQAMRHLPHDPNTSPQAPPSTLGITSQHEIWRGHPKCISQDPNLPPDPRTPKRYRPCSQSEILRHATFKREDPIQSTYGGLCSPLHQQSHIQAQGPPCWTTMPVASEQPESSVGDRRLLQRADSAMHSLHGVAQLDK